MPVPSADESQSKVLGNLIDLSQTASVDAVNQIALVDRQLQDMQKATDLFESRYNYWHSYISQYELEKQYLNGLYLLNPLPAAHSSLYPQPGNVFSDFVYVEGSTLDDGGESPKRIPEYDGQGALGVEPSRESASLIQEALARDVLCNGFSNNGITGTIRTMVAITPNTNPVMMEAISSGSSIASGGRIYISNGSNSCIAQVGAVVVIPGPSPSDPDTFSVELDYQSSFSTIAANASVVDSVSGFTNAERTSQVAANPSRQNLLNSLMQNYFLVIDEWLIALTIQGNCIDTVTEDNPDLAYNNSRQDTETFVQAWINAPLYSDASLNTIVDRTQLRTTEIPARVAWINARLQEASYDERYKYSDLLFNKAIGSYTQTMRFQKAKTMLQAQQPVLAARAAAYAEEQF